MNNIISKEIFEQHVAMIVDAYVVDERISEHNLADIHQEVFNTECFIIGRYQASEWMKKHNIDAFQLIEFVQSYERSNFGETNTKLNSESMVNMFSFIVGEKVLFELDLYCEDFEEFEEKINNIIIERDYE